jgi:putative FmdB family regulatory protein
MPLYEYHCDACEKDFEANQRMTEDALTDCPLCGVKDQVKKLMSAGSGLIFKGSGFYITDYKNAKDTRATEPSAAKSEPSSESGSTKESAPKTETKSSETASPKGASSDCAAK